MSGQHHPEIDLSANCDCGSITLSVKGRILSMFQCACHNCQKVSGSGHSSVVLVPADSVAISGATRSISRPAASGASFTRHFCPECGTTLAAASSRAPGVKILPAGLFAGQNDWFAPNQLIFARDQMGWDLIADHLPRHQTYRGAPQP
ncbi:GFA family protein [Devosia sp. SD17-2]|jgi:hypothetical protein|uniref:GFA family protein n=1 Tax=Devosia sp. SD17-2 TaxID=2976459 RepID=UPI0031F31E05